MTWDIVIKITSYFPFRNLAKYLKDKVPSFTKPSICNIYLAVYSQECTSGKQYSTYFVIKLGLQKYGKKNHHLSLKIFILIPYNAQLGLEKTQGIVVGIATPSPLLHIPPGIRDPENSRSWDTEPADRQSSKSHVLLRHEVKRHRLL